MPVDPNAEMEVTAYRWVPPMARGRVKDLRVRWALEEIGASYRVRLVGGAGGEKSPEHLADQPFGQVPVYRERGLTLFESGAILVHIGGKDARLLPRDPVAQAQAIGWTFAALNSIEPITQTYFLVGFLADGRNWREESRDLVRPFAERRLAQLASRLGDSEWLDGGFSIADIAMAHVLAAGTDPTLVAAHSNLAAYVARATGRPAYREALAAQLADFENSEPSAN